MLVLIRRLTPRESSRIGLVKHRDKRDTDEHRLKLPAVGHVNLAAATGLLRVLLKSWFEYRGPEVNAWQAKAVHATREAFGLDPGRADQLERTRRAAPLGDEDAFEQHRPGIDDGRVECRHVWRRHDPRQVGSVGIHFPFPAFH